MSNFFTSLIRTIVPTIVGVAVAWAVKHGINIDEAEVNAWLIPLCISAYYTVARYLEIKVPEFGWLLGMAKAPGYAGGVAPPAKPSPGNNPDLGDGN